MSVGLTRPARVALGVLPAVLVLAAAVLAFYKINYLGYNLNDVVQSESYYIETIMELDGHGSGVNVAMALPQNLSSQRISDESFSSDDLQFHSEMENGNRVGVWNGRSVTGQQRIGYVASVRTTHQKYVIDSTLPTLQTIPNEAAAGLLPDSAIQSDSPEISRLADSLGLSTDLPLLANVTKIYDYVTDGLEYVKYSGTTDALTAYHLHEASCGGKSRLMVALARNLGIPGRLVGGKILSSGQSKATHIWVELFLNGYWVPFCPTNHYFAEMPSNYLVLYYGERPVIAHTKDINFKYYFNLKKRLASTQAGLNRLRNHPLDILNVWSTFKRVAISLELLRIIIMLPIGVLAVVIFRNLIGIETFGTFMPTLIAIGFRDTGLGNGILLFGMIIAFGSLVRLGVNRLQLLHTPRLAIILSTVVLFLLSMTAIGVWLGFLDLSRVVLFPIVILTLTVERFSIHTEESGVWHALRVTILTLIVASFAYSLMAWRMLQSIVISFPETILLVIALYIYIGRYSGFRLIEYVRFKDLLVRA